MPEIAGKKRRYATFPGWRGRNSRRSNCLCHCRSSVTARPVRAMTETGNVDAIFSELTGGLDHAMLIVTAASGAERAGCLVGFATRCSITPPRFLVCLSNRNYTYRIASRAHALAVHVLPATAIDLATLFGGETGDDIDKFALCRWHEGPEGLPILDRCESWFAGVILGTQPFGDHVGFVLEPVAAEYRRPATAFSSQRAKMIDPGHGA